MKIEGYKRIIKGDYPAEYQNLVERLSGSINDGFQALYQVLNNKVTLSDNLAATIGVFQVTVDSSGKPTATTSFKLNASTTSVLGIQVIKLENLTNSAGYPTSGPFISFTTANGQVQVLNITGLTPGNLYRVTAVAYAS